MRMMGFSMYLFVLPQLFLRFGLAQNPSGKKREEANLI